MKILMKLLEPLLAEIHVDLSRSHPFAAERVGFLTCGMARTQDGDIQILGHQWHKVADEDYVDDPAVGASIGPTAFRKILQIAYQQPVSVFHVHRHEHLGQPAFSKIDIRSSRQFVPDFFNVRPTHPHGTLVLSIDRAAGEVWLPGRADPQSIEQFRVVGVPLRRWP